MGLAFWNVPYPRNTCFTGRGDVVAALRKQLTRRGRAALAQAQAQAISGLGGIGKTQTAVEYAYHYREKYRAVFWVNAESTLALKTGYSELARALQLPHPKDDLDAAALAFLHWLRTETGWLLVLDNADDPALLKPFLSDASHGHTLITSRAQDFQGLGIVAPVELERWGVEDATAFLLKRCVREEAEGEERKAAGKLARELDRLPLALEQAAAYMVQRKAPFRLYLESYRVRGLKLLESHGPALGDYPRSVVTTWAANFEAVREESPASADVLRASAFLAPDDIPFALLRAGAADLGEPVANALAGAAEDPLLVNDLLQPLARFSLIRVSGDGDTYGTHRLVQEVIKDAMDEPARRDWAERVVRAVSRAFPSVEFGTWPQCQRLLPHALALASEIERDGIEISEAGRLLNQVAFYLDDRGQFAEAEPLYLKATERYRTALGERHPAYATLLNNLATLYRAMGRHAEAAPLYLEATELLRTALGERHPAYATSLNNLALLYHVTGRHAEAEPLYLKATELRRTALGERHPDYATSLNNLAGLYDALGRHAEAEPLYLKATELRRTALGERHPDYAASLNNLAGLYYAMGRHVEAEPLYRQAVGILRSALGTSHPNYQAGLRNYVINQQNGGLPLPDVELLKDLTGGLPAPPPPEEGGSEAGPEGSGTSTT